MFSNVDMHSAALIVFLPNVFIVCTSDAFSRDVMTFYTNISVTRENKNKMRSFQHVPCSVQ